MPRRLDRATTEAKQTALQKRMRAVDLRVHGKNWQQIADEVGYSGPNAAHKAVSEYFRMYPKNEEADELRRTENLKLDALEEKYWDIIRRDHLVVNAKGVVERRVTDERGRPVPLRDETGEFVYREVGNKTVQLYVTVPLLDDDPAIRCLNGLLQVYARRARLNGLDRPVKVEIEDSSIDQEIIDLVNQMAGAGNPPEIRQNT